MLLNLPAQRRVCYCNLVLVILFGGSTKPDCELLMQHLNSFFQNFDGKLWVDGTDRQVKLKIKCIVVDAVMRAPLMNQTQFNGRYGCAHCLVAGRHAESKSIWIYPYTRKEDSIRTSEERKKMLSKNPSR